jgi:hypothetical protein
VRKLNNKNHQKTKSNEVFVGLTLEFTNLGRQNSIISHSSELTFPSQRYSLALQAAGQGMEQFFPSGPEKFFN